MKDFLKKMWPTILFLLVSVVAGLDGTVREFIATFAVAHPVLANLILGVYIAVANWIRGLQVPSVREAEKTLDKAIDKRDAKG